MVQNEELRIVRGNAFNIKIQVEAIRLDGTKVDNFNLAEANAQLKVWHAGQKTVKEFVIDGNSAIISFAGTEMLGWYGLEMSGTFESAPWRFAVVQVFQIVETNEKANVPSWTILTDQTYFVEGVLTLYANGATHQADWDETNPTSPSYIKNKPTVVSPTQLQQAVNAEKKRAEAAEQANAAATAKKYTKPSGGIPSTDMTEAVQTSLQKAENAAPQATTYTKEQVDAMIADFITRSVNDLMNYYLKSETYTKAEVQQLIDTVKQFTYEVANTLPTASADTMHKIYLVPSTNPQTQNVKDEYITILDGSAYKWEQIGSTTVDLSGYYTSTQTDQAISNALTSALSNYSTTAQMNTAITTALNNALAAYSTTQQMNAAIAAALTPYYTKTEIDTLLGNKADIDGNYPQLVVGNVVGEFNQEAEVSFRPSAGTVDIQSGYKVNYGGHLEGVKGNTVSWNQLYDSAVPTAVTGHKYYCRENNSGTIRTAIVLAADLATWFTEASTERNVRDLSITYGIGNEPSTVADFEAYYFLWFGKPLAYEAYNPGELIPVKMAGIKTVGFNAWDEEWDIGLIDSVTGINIGGNAVRSKNYIPVIPGEAYCYHNGSNIAISLFYYDANQNYLGFLDTCSNGRILTFNNNVRFIRFYTFSAYGITYNHDICINLSHSGSRNGQYETYWDFLLNFDVRCLYGRLNGEGSRVQAFPDGMRSVGTVYDVIDITKREAICATGRKIFDNNEAWGKTFDGVFYSSINSSMKSYSNNINTKYIAGASGDSAAAFKGTDKTLRCGSDKRYVLKDTSCADVGAVKTAMNGVEIIYELATPLNYTDLVYRINGVDYPLEGALPYKVDDYGTEEVVAISGEKTVAPVLQLRYGINVGDTTKNLPFNYLSPKMQQTFTEDEKRQARKNIGVDATRADVLALIRANEDALLTALKTAGTITDYTLDAEADANGVYGVTVS